MSLELEKSMRIISDLISFCYYEGAEEFAMGLRLNEDNSIKLQVSCPIEGLDMEKYEEMKLTLSLPRQHEVEQQYWELSGETEFSSELSLVGAMSDRTEVSYIDNILSITIHRDD